MLFATAVAGVVGYAIQLLAPSLLVDPAAYVAFSVFWSSLYLGGAAISGVQQEVARTTHPDRSGAGGRALLIFLVGATAVVAVIALAVSTLLGGAILPQSRGALTAALVVGFVGYLATSILTGVFYGLHLWSAVAFAVIADALIRAALVIAGLVLGWDVAVLAILVALPFGIAAALSWLLFRRSVKAAFRLDVGLGRLITQVTSTVGASTASGIMISGLPMLIGLTSGVTTQATTAALLLAVTVTRAPIVIPIIALQSFLISSAFRRGGVDPLRLIRLIGVVLAGGLLLAAVGWFAGPQIFSAVSAGRYSITSAMAGVIVFSAVVVAALCITGPALISMRHHAANLVGWVVAAAATVVILILPIGELRVPVALVVPPALGLMIHLLVVVRPTPAGGLPTAR